MTTIDRRSLFAGSVAALTVAVAPPMAGAKPYFPLPDGLTSEWIRDAAATMRSTIPHMMKPKFVGEIDRGPYWLDRLKLTIEIFERMATCEEPFDALDAEMWRRVRELSVKHDYFPS